VAELKEKFQISTYTLYSVTVSDRFSNLGLVGAIGIEGDMLDLFALSCRALGRNIEELMIAHIKNHLIKTVYQVSTGKNSVLLERLSELVEV
jgi:predicted enzyme involved in methoxymalonyl-ACP biosynthesis